jgi:hypothetical protein
MNRIAAALLSTTALLAALGPACAQQQAEAVTARGQQFVNVVGSTTTRSNNTTAYSANESVCAAACVAGTLAIPPAAYAGQPGIAPSGYQGQGAITSFRLLKSGSSTTNADFIVWLYAAAPLLTSPTQNDATSYTGPRAADMPNYLGNAACATPIATSDSSPGVWYECTLSNPNTAGALIGQWLHGTEVNYIISVTAAYTPAASETFTPYIGGFY